MLSKNINVLSAVNENSFAASRDLNGPFSVIPDEPSSFKYLSENAQWTFLEMAKYVAFLQLNAKRIEGKAYKHLWGVFQEMGKFIQSRNFRQVKSYHQKMIEKHHIISEIVCFHLTSYPQIEAYLEQEKQNIKMNKMSPKKSNECPKVQASTSDCYLNKDESLNISQNQEKQHQNVFAEWSKKLKNLTNLMCV